VEFESMRAQWKGFLQFGGVSCAVALYTAASTADRIAFATINKSTGNRVKREYVDVETGKPVEREQQVKGYEFDDGRFITLTPEEVAAALPEGDKSLKVDAFILCSDVQDTFFDKPYYLVPADRLSYDAFALLRDGMRDAKVAAIAKAILARTVLIRPHGNGLIANTLNYDYEVRSAKEAFKEVPPLEIKGEMLDLAQHIIDTKSGTFDPRHFSDRYEAALAELVKAKLEGRSSPKRKAPIASKPSDLLEALRMSAGGVGPRGGAKRAAANANATRPSKPGAKIADIAVPRRKAG
jgi:DNA end-binding protein Ku